MCHLCPPPWPAAGRDGRCQLRRQDCRGERSRRALGLRRREPVRRPLETRHRVPHVRPSPHPNPKPPRALVVRRLSPGGAHSSSSPRSHPTMQRAALAVSRAPTAGKASTAPPASEALLAALGASLKSEGDALAKRVKKASAKPRTPSGRAATGAEWGCTFGKQIIKTCVAGCRASGKAATWHVSHDSATIRARMPLCSSARSHVCMHPCVGGLAVWPFAVLPRLSVRFTLDGSFRLQGLHMSHCFLHGCAQAWRLHLRPNCRHAAFSRITTQMFSFPNQNPILKKIRRCVARRLEWTLDMRVDAPDGGSRLVKGPPSEKPDLTVTVNDANFAQLVMGKLNPQQVNYGGVR
eukprot:353069-Chlamydomonas_euryale.AAC.18